ncbi:MAG TPA: zinc ABC transporter substrate-binding protein [Candidatus Dormibacteraeota bacterium]|nr:zinc ABC transporter substrate-binding protein [Candidatus Dormibacteraeota bacterium]
MCKRRPPRHASMTAGIALLALSLLAACGSSPSAATAGGRLNVVAAENFWGDITSQIGGSHVSVTSIITDPNADPHSYETNPRDAAALSGATLVIENGAKYDTFVGKLLSTNPNAGRDVLTIATVVGVSGDNPNPHLWYNPLYVTTAARAIESHLASHDPGDAATFAANLQTFLSAYQPYIDAVQAIKTRYSDTPIAYTERVAGYLVNAAGLRLATPASFAQSIEDGNDPAPADVAAMDAAMTGRLVKVLLYNAQVTSPVTQSVKSLASSNGIPVVGVAETIPSGQHTFQSWQIAQARAILAALGG